MPQHPRVSKQVLRILDCKSVVIAVAALGVSLVWIIRGPDLWAILMPEFVRSIQLLEINTRFQTASALLYQLELARNLVDQMLGRWELVSLEIGSRPLPVGSRIKSVLMIGACDISVIIPALNEEKYLPRCLESLARQPRREQFEIIVVDGGSKDRTVEIAKEHAQKVIEKPTPVGTARNIGAKHAEGKILAFIDADTKACEGWINEIARTFDSDPNAVGVTGPTLPYEGTQLDKLAYHVATGWAQRFSLKLGRPHVAGFNCAYRRGPFFDAGGFDENRVLSEDVTLSMKMRHQGTILFNPEMIAYTSLRRIKRYGYPYLTTYYAINAAMMLLFNRTLGYPQIR